MLLLLDEPEFLSELPPLLSESLPKSELEPVVPPELLLPVLVVEPEIPPVLPEVPPILEELVLPVPDPLPLEEEPLVLEPASVLPDVLEPASVFPEVFEPALVLPVAPDVDDLEVPAVLSLSELPPALLLFVEAEISVDDLPVSFFDLLLSLFEPVLLEFLF